MSKHDCGISDSQILISVVVTGKNDALHLQECLQSLLNVAFPRETYEVIYVDAQSNDESLEIANALKETYGNFRFLVEAGLSGHGRNEGIRKARGQIIAFVDTDCIVHESWLTRMALHLISRQDDVVGVGGPSLTPMSDNKFSRAVGYLWETTFGSGGARNPAIYKGKRFVEHNPTCNSAYLRSVFGKVGLFSEQLPVTEDEEFDTRIRRLKLRLLYSEDIIVWHHRRNSLKSFLKQMYSYGFWRALSGKRKMIPLKPWHFGPSILVVGLLAMPILFFTHMITCYGILLLLPYAIFVLVASLQTARRTRNYYYSFAVPILGFLQHVAYGIGFIVGFAHSR
jgi:glycosyltransferase involved in cell wall biosynthesis